MRAASLRSALTAFMLLGGLMVAPRAVADPRSLFIETEPGVEIHVIEDGQVSERPVLVLVPGWRLTASIWRAQIAAFSKTGMVIAIDPRSQGESTKTPDGDTPEARARDIQAIITRLGPQPVVLVGWSQGVQDVAAYVTQFGVQHLKGVVLVDSPVSRGALGVEGSPKGAAQQLRLMSLFVHNPRPAAEAMMHAIIRKPLPQDRFEGLVENALRTPTAIGAAMLLDDLFGPDRTPALAKLQVPTLVVASEFSAELEAQKQMAAQLPHGRFEVVTDAGHAVFIDQPDRFNTLLGSFISGLK